MGVFRFCICNNKCMKQLKNTISDNLISLRKRSKLTQMELAEKLNYSDKTISKWENGEAIPSVEVLISLADFYHVSLDDIVNENFNVNKTFSVSGRRISHLVISLLCIVSVWLVASCVFTGILLYPSGIGGAWLSFIFPIPASCLLALICVCIWCNKGRRFLIHLFSYLLIWTTILAVYLAFIVGGVNIWMLWIVGIPIQIIVSLSLEVARKNK